MKPYRRILPCILALASVVLIAACEKGDISTSSQVLARVGDKEITTTYFDRQIANLPESVQKLTAQGEGKKAILEALVNRELLYGKALEQKVDKGVELQQKLEELNKELIINTYIQGEILGRVKVDESEIQRFYDSNPAEFQNREELRISQIVVADQEQAEAMLQKLSIRREFGELAQVHSSDKASAARQGDVGWFTRSKLPETVRDSVFKLQVGEISQPFKLEQGYEIYKITDRRVVSLPLDQVRDAISAQIYNEKLQSELKVLVAELKKTTTVQLNEKLLQ